MKNKKIIVCIIIIFIIGISIGVIINSNQSNNKIVSGYSFELSDKNIINKKYEGKYLESFVTIVEQQDDFEINLEGISPDSNMFLIDPTDGAMTNMKYENEKFVVKTKLNKDINYGIIMNYNLVGSIRVVDDIKSVDEENLFTEILIGLGCGL